ncbi:helix-turn-helix transcriptional regulator [Massilia sp. TN1-12]
MIELIGLERTVIYERIKAGTFPAPVQIGPRRLPGMQKSCLNGNRA